MTDTVSEEPTVEKFYTKDQLNLRGILQYLLDHGMFNGTVDDLKPNDPGETFNFTLKRGTYIVTDMGKDIDGKDRGYRAYPVGYEQLAATSYSPIKALRAVFFNQIELMNKLSEARAIMDRQERRMANIKWYQFWKSTPKD